MHAVSSPLGAIKTIHTLARFTVGKQRCRQGCMRRRKMRYFTLFYRFIESGWLIIMAVWCVRHVLWIFFLISHRYTVNHFFYFSFQSFYLYLYLSILIISFLFLYKSLSISLCLFHFQIKWGMVMVRLSIT